MDSRATLSSVTCPPMFMQFTGCHQPFRVSTRVNLQHCWQCLFLYLVLAHFASRMRHISQNVLGTMASNNSEGTIKLIHPLRFRHLVFIASTRNASPMRKFVHETTFRATIVAKKIVFKNGSCNISLNDFAS